MEVCVCVCVGGVEFYSKKREIGSNVKIKFHFHFQTFVEVLMDCQHLFGGSM